MSASFIFDQCKSELSGIESPTTLTGITASLFSALFDLERTERLPPEDLAAMQEVQIAKLLHHASSHVPYYAERFRQVGFRPGEQPLGLTWATIPLLQKSDIRSAGSLLHAANYPAGHGKTDVRTTSGSTSEPVRVVTTDYSTFLWRCINLRDRAWHKIDLGATLIELTHSKQIYREDFIEIDTWSLNTASLKRPGRRVKINPFITVQKQLGIIESFCPGYILSRPSQLNLLLRECETEGRRIPSLKAVFCVTETVTDALRQICLDVLGVAIIDCYSCAEMGYLALQCPRSNQYHVQSEFVRLEVLRSDNTVCEPGETGRVVVTDLHNYAMPLIRYDLGDEAVVGTECACGRTLPVLHKILGRTQDYLKLHDGRLVRADIQHYEIAKLEPILEFQVVQCAIGLLQIYLVVRRQLDDQETRTLRALLSSQGGENLRVDIIYCERINRTRAGKHLQFICRVP